MASLIIPEEYRGGLAKLIHLDDQAARVLLSALVDIPLALNYKDLAESIKSRVTEVPPDDIDKIIEVLVTFNYARYSAEITLQEFIDDVINAIERIKSEELQIPKDGYGGFRQRLTEFLEAKSLRVASKARAIQRDQNYFFCSARLVTDVRPVFESGIDESIVVVPVHMLKISYHHGDKIRDIFIAMDKSDLKELRDLIEKAEAEAVNLRSTLEAAKVSYVED